MDAAMRRESVKAELDRRFRAHLEQLWRQNPELKADVAAEVIWRRVARDIGMSRIEIARAQAAYRDYCAARQSRSRNRKKAPVFV
jgi:FixJ family two-component response regulator